MSTTDLERFDRVTLLEGVQVGEVVSVREGAWSNGKVAMVTVEWPSIIHGCPGSFGRHTASQLRKVEQ